MVEYFQICHFNHKSICTVPLSGFNSKLPWFRMTLLEEDENKFRKILEDIVEVFEKIKK